MIRLKQSLDHVASEAISGMVSKSQSDQRGSLVLSNQRKLPSLKGDSSAELNDKLKALQETIESPVQFPNLFGQKEFSDLHFSVGASIYYSHQAIVEKRCPALLSYFQKGSSKKGNVLVIKIDEKLIDCSTLHHVLFYIYTSNLLFHELTPDKVISLLQAAEYLSLHRLVWICECYLNCILTPDLFFVIMKSARNIQRVKKICLEYGSCIFKELIVNKEGVNSLGLDAFREFVVYSVISGETSDGPKSSVMENTIQQDFKSVYTNMNSYTGIMHLKDGSVAFHKYILFSYSQKFASFFTKNQDTNVYKPPKDTGFMSSKAFSSLLEYLYFKNSDFSALHAAQMLPFVEKFDLNELVSVCEQKISIGISSESVLSILLLCYLPNFDGKYRKLYMRPCIQYILEHYSEIDFKILKLFSPEIGHDLCVAVNKAISSGFWKSKSTISRGSSGCSVGIEDDRESLPAIKWKKSGKISFLNSTNSDSESNPDFSHLRKSDEGKNRTRDSEVKERRKSSERRRPNEFPIVRIGKVQGSPSPTEGDDEGRIQKGDSEVKEKRRSNERRSSERRKASEFSTPRVRKAQGSSSSLTEGNPATNNEKNDTERKGVENEESVVNIEKKELIDTEKETFKSKSSSPKSELESPRAKAHKSEGSRISLKKRESKGVSNNEAVKTPTQDAGAGTK